MLYIYKKKQLHAKCKRELKRKYFFRRCWKFRIIFVRKIKSEMIINKCLTIRNVFRGKNIKQENMLNKDKSLLNISKFNFLQIILKKRQKSK